jgi:crossover junction endodeoxyribonuclease RuvC
MKGEPPAKAASPTRILGLDPGLRVTGFGVIDCHGAHLCFQASGGIRTPEKESLPHRLKVLFDGVQTLMTEYGPHEIAVEKVFVNVNPQSTLLLGQARGALLCSAMSTGKTVFEYTALQIKQAVVGYGKADKSQVSHMVCRLLSLEGNPSADAADALACAICHAHQRAHPLSRLKRL